MRKEKTKATGRMSTRGRVTIPLDVRKRLGLRKGDAVEFVDEGGKTIFRRARPSKSPFEKYRGALGTFPGGKEEINAWLRKLRDESDDE